MGTSFPHDTYDQKATLLIIIAFSKQPLVRARILFFNDPLFIQHGLATKLGGHHNHIHIRINPPPIREQEPS